MHFEKNEKRHFVILHVMTHDSLITLDSDVTFVRHMNPFVGRLVVAVVKLPEDKR